MNERERLIQRLKNLFSIISAKQRRYQEENNLPADYGCITRESCVLASLVPEMRRLGVTFKDCKPEGEK